MILLLVAINNLLSVQIYTVYILVYIVLFTLLCMLEDDCLAKLLGLFSDGSGSKHLALHALHACCNS